MNNYDSNVNGPKNIEQELYACFETGDYFRCKQVLQEKGNYLKEEDRKNWEEQLMLLINGGLDLNKKGKDVALQFVCFLFLSFIHLILLITSIVILVDKSFIAAILVFVLLALINYVLNTVINRHYRNKWGFMVFRQSFYTERYSLKNMVTVFNIYSAYYIIKRIIF